MKQIIASILVIVAIISIIVLIFTINQVEEEKQSLQSDLTYRSILLAESLKETIEPNFINKSHAYLQTLAEKFTNQKRFAGLGIYDSKGNGVAFSSNLAEATAAAQPIITNTMDEDKANGHFSTISNKKIYLLAVPLHNSDDSVAGALIVAQNAGYIDERLNAIWRNSLLRLAIQVSLFSLATLLLLRWVIYLPIKSLVEVLRSTRAGNGKGTTVAHPTNFFLFRPLINEITQIRRNLQEARGAEETRLPEQIDAPWTSHRLKDFIQESLKGRSIYVVSSREPYIHTKSGNKIIYYFPASGMNTALEPIMHACGGTWIAYGSGDADKLVVNKSNKIKVPPDNPKYTLKRVWLTKEEEKGYYVGFSNEALWPLCHMVHTRPIFRQEDWEQYKIVNQKFADTILSEIKDLERPIVLVQDFHLSLVPKMIKASKPSAVIGLFWHIPWPNSEIFSVCPWKKEILDGMLGADLLGFHTQLHSNNFMETAGKELESLIDIERFAVTKNNHTTFVKPFPISIAFPNGFNGSEDHLEGKDILKSLKVNTKHLGLGVDRLDYTKGILERLKAVEIFLLRYPSYKGRFTFIQIAAPSRTKVQKYQDFAVEVRKEVERINSAFRIKNWRPIVYLERHHSHEEIKALYKVADVCLVTSLHDGMNLVAKEFVAARDDEKGVLILSQYTGASKELKDAVIVNPYNGDQTADAIFEALEMKESEQIKRMKRLRQIIKDNNIYRWSYEFLKALMNLS